MAKIAPWDGLDCNGGRRSYGYGRTGQLVQVQPPCSVGSRLGVTEDGWTWIPAWMHGSMYSGPGRAHALCLVLSKVIHHLVLYALCRGIEFFLLFFSPPMVGSYLG